MVARPERFPAGKHLGRGYLFAGIAVLNFVHQRLVENELNSVIGNYYFSETEINVSVLSKSDKSLELLPEQLESLHAVLAVVACSGRDRSEVQSIYRSVLICQGH